MKPLMAIAIVLGLIAAVILILLLFSSINHGIRLKEEREQYKPPGKIIQVNDKRLHIYAEGEGDYTLVFLSGHGTSCPTLDFKPLWKRLVDQHRIVVVERSGYGWSSPSRDSRDIHKILEETRLTLERGGEKGPFVLVPHSMSGLEAIYWAQKYPEEVKAIIGLDPCVPGNTYLIPDSNGLQLRVLQLLAKTGITRFMPEEQMKESLPLLELDGLSQEDKDVYRSMFYRSSFSEDMLREVDFLKKNAGVVEMNDVPVNIPMYFFISDQQDADLTGWKDQLQGYLSKLQTGKHKILQTGHYIHHRESETISREIEDFLMEIQEEN